MESTAVLISIISVWLATRRSLWHFPFAFASVGLYGVIFFRVKLYADVVLQGIFAVMLAYGLLQWLSRRARDGRVIVTRATAVELGSSLLLAAPASVVLGALLARHTDAALPYLDSALLSASLAGSFLGARRRVENWWVWILVDLIYVGVYLYKQLFLTALLYAAFVILAIVGLRSWLRTYHLQESASQAPTGADSDSVVQSSVEIAA